MPPVSDPADVRVLIPRVRRALDGPQATGSAAPSSKLTDDEVTNVIADAIADIIFYSGGAFGHTLIVTSRDSYYMAPSGWKTSEALSEPEGSVISAQAALNYIYRSLETLKTSETIKKADREWAWSISASAMAERIKELRAARDSALDLLREQNVTADTWVNTLEVRDAYTDRLIEPWLSSGGYLPSGQEFDPPIGP